jgi:hypothetical protein
MIKVKVVAASTLNTAASISPPHSELHRGRDHTCGLDVNRTLSRRRGNSLRVEL